MNVTRKHTLPSGEISFGPLAADRFIFSRLVAPPGPRQGLEGYGQNVSAGLGSVTSRAEMAGDPMVAGAENRNARGERVSVRATPRAGPGAVESGAE